MDDQTYYGAPETTNDAKTLRERLRDLYNPEDFVTVINIDTDPIRYQFTNPADHETFTDNTGAKETVLKNNPVVMVLQPGQTRLCPAYEADLMIENLIKQITNKRTNAKVESGELNPRVATTNWNDPYTQQELLKKIFLGKRDLMATFNETLQTADTSTVEKDLDLDVTPEPARVGRPRKAQ